MELPERKHPRLKNYDYSQPGYYYVTIHTASPEIRLSSVGRGLAPAEAVIRLTRLGEIAENQLLDLQSRYSCVRLDKYVIMPTHIHAIICIENGENRPSLTDVICAYKSLTTRIANLTFDTPGRKQFQISFFETVLRNKKAYQECWRYTEDNPQKWLVGQDDG